MADCVSALKEWTGKASARIIYDSIVDEFTDDGIFENVRGKENVAVVGFTTDGDVFGAFYSVAVTVQDKYIFDPDIFAFSFESHGRCTTPQRFVLKEKKKELAYVRFDKGDSQGFVYFGVYGTSGFWLGKERSASFCRDMSRGFDGLEDKTLTGETGGIFCKGPHHHCARLVAVQLE